MAALTNRSGARVNLARRKYVPHTIAAVAITTVLVSMAAPAEERLGDTVKLIYLHASVTWVALCAFAAAGIVGIAALARRSDRLSCWSTALLATATAFWTVHFALGLVTMRLAWGDWFWSEPRIRAGMLILGVSVAATLLALAAEKNWTGPALSIAVVTFIVVLLATAGRVFHPAGAIRESNSLAIKGSVLVIVLLTLVASIQTTRLFAGVFCSSAGSDKATAAET